MRRGASIDIIASVAQSASRRCARSGSLVLVLLAAVMATVSPPASANSCAEACRNQHNQCRIQTKGSSSCDAALTQCLSRCSQQR